MNRSLFWLLNLLFLTLILHGCDSKSGAPEAENPKSAPVDVSQDTSHAKGQKTSTLHSLNAPLETRHPEGEGTPKIVAPLGPQGPTLIFTSALKGYVEPCTCTLDILLGGIDRVSGYVRTFQKTTPNAMIDTGNILFEDVEIPEEDIPQALLKAALLLDGVKAMGGLSTIPGPLDLSLGLETYLRLIDEAGLSITATNLTDTSGKSIGAPWRMLEIEGLKIGFIAIIEPSLMTPFSDVQVTPPAPATQNALSEMKTAGSQVNVAVIQGSRSFAREVIAGAPTLDFVIIGNDPQDTDAVSYEGETAIVEAFSQGRNVGILKFYPKENTPGRFINARLGSISEIEKVDRRIAHLDRAIGQAPPAPAQGESPFVTKLRADLKELKARRLLLSSEGVSLPEKQNAFAYFSVPMTPGYPHDLAILQRKKRYNDRLEILYTKEMSLPIPPLAKGQAGYIGIEACLNCHEDAHDIWEETPHSHAWEALVKKGKTFDPECVSCHVTGYGSPGGSIVGKVAGLESVQCEVCHGPGSIHAKNPSDLKGPGQIHKEAPASLCVTCHDPANSPRFDYDRYLPLILGDGHGR